MASAPGAGSSGTGARRSATPRLPRARPHPPPDPIHFRFNSPFTRDHGNPSRSRGECGTLSHGRSQPSGHDGRLYASVDARETVPPKRIPGNVADEPVRWTAWPPGLPPDSTPPWGVQRSVAVTKGSAALWRGGYRIGATSRRSRRFRGAGPRCVNTARECSSQRRYIGVAQPWGIPEERLFIVERERRNNRPTVGGGCLNPCDWRDTQW